MIKHVKWDFLKYLEPKQSSDLCWVVLWVRWGELWRVGQAVYDCASAFTSCTHIGPGLLKVQHWGPDQSLGKYVNFLLPRNILELFKAFMDIPLTIYFSCPNCYLSLLVAVTNTLSCRRFWKVLVEAALALDQFWVRGNEGKLFGPVFQGMTR